MPRVPHASGSRLWLCALSGLRLGPLRVMERALQVLDERARGTRFLSHAARSILNPPESTGIGCWSLNPYVGCEFGCSYCYARYAHRYAVQRVRDAGRVTAGEFRELNGEAGRDGFEHQILVKERVSVMAALDRDLGRVLTRYARGERHPVLIGTATDPYQPAERHFGITRAILQRLTRVPRLNVGLITKSPLVTRDAHLLAELSQRHRITVHISLISTSRRLIRAFETRSPMPHTRLRALEKLVHAGVNAGVLVAPVLPGITDHVPHLRRLLAAARRHGARFAHPSPLRLYDAVRPVFLPELERTFPNLVARYRESYRRSRDVPRAYARALSARFSRLARELGLATDNHFGNERAQWSGPAQLTLWRGNTREDS